jgi:formylglycine-generating enzyme required for sulfatase activity
VDDPTLCHDHSEVPDTWPPLLNILNYAARVRSRITESLDSGLAVKDRRLGRGLWLAYEHEAMHLETFLYMLIQSERILPPPGTDRPDFKALAEQARYNRVENKWHQIPTQEVTIGLDDAENNLGPDRYFGWDNERPSRTVSVKAFEAQSRPISNGEYAHFLEATHKNSVPASWITGYSVAQHTNGINGSSNGTNHLLTVASAGYIEDKAVRTVYGLIPLKYTLDWPVMASYDELAAYAKWANGRIPTLEEARSIYSYVDSTKSALEQSPSKLISAVNG